MPGNTLMFYLEENLKVSPKNHSSQVKVNNQASGNICLAYIPERRNKIITYD